MNNILGKRDNETDFEWKVRLGVNKVKREVPYVDYDWQELVNILNLECSSDHFRKLSYAYTEYTDYVNQKKIDNVSQETLDEINEKLLEIKKEKVKLQDERNLVNNKIRQMARKESFIDLIRENIDRLCENNPMITNIIPYGKSSGNDAVLLCSDWHVGITVDNYLNQYDIDICKERLNKLCNKTIQYCDMNNVDVLHIAFLGDLISNEIHNILRFQNQLSLSEQLVTASELVSELIFKLSKNVKFITVHIINGNHERSIQDKNDALDRDTYIGLIREIVKLRIKGLSNVLLADNTHDDEITTINIKGHRFAAMHGHNINRSKVSYQMNNILDSMFDYVLLGHFHQAAEEMQYKCQVITNGSLVGSDMYSKKLKLHTYPMQKLLMVNEEDGVYCSYNIRVD